MRRLHACNNGYKGRLKVVKNLGGCLGSAFLVSFAYRKVYGEIEISVS
jgi:hypothetical protein